MKKLAANVARYNKLPSSIIQASLDVLEDVLKGQDLPDPTNPFMFLLESSCTNTSAAIMAGQSVARKIYPTLANDQIDLYNHMSDVDYIGRWALPAHTTLGLLLPLTDVLSRAVGNPNNLIKSLRIPRNTSVMVNGIPLGIHYPIRIDVLPHGAIQATYESDQISPLHKLTTNIVESDQVVIDGVTFLMLNIPASQFQIESLTVPLTSATAYVNKTPFQDKFLYARAWIDRGAGSWEEILTTHSLQVYDKDRPTLLLEVHNNTLISRLPDVYVNTGLVGDSLRLDIYTTRGAMEVDLTEIPNKQFTYELRDLDDKADSTLVEAMSKIVDGVMFAAKPLSGGRNELAIEDLKARVIYGADSTRAPITPGEVETNARLQGYDTVRYNDNVTGRLFVASKPLPLRTYNNLTIPANAANSLVVFDETDTRFSTAIVNHVARKRATILPKALYKSNGHNMVLLTDVELANLNNLDTERRVGEYNRGTYMYSPFHYVLDYSTGTLGVNAFLLTQPEVKGRTSEAANEHLDYSIVTSSAEIALNDATYQLTIKARVPDNYQTSVVARLAYRDDQIENLGHFDATGTLTGPNELTFTFDIPTGLDIDGLNQIKIDDFTTPNGTITIYIPLTSKFNLFYLISGLQSNYPTMFDTKYTRVPTPNIVGVTHETITLMLGRTLEHLYIPNRSIIGEPVYRKHTVDVPATYDEDVYSPGPHGAAYTTLPDGRVSLNRLHSKGDPVLDAQNNPVLKHRVGDDVIVNGERVVEKPASIQRTIGITMVNAMYRVGTSTKIRAYNDSIPVSITAYLDNEIAPAAKQMEARTELKYKPRGNSAMVRVSIGNGISTVIDSDIDVQVSYYLTEAGYNNDELRAKLSANVNAVVSNEIAKVRLSAIEIETKLKEDGGPEVIGVDVRRWGPKYNIPILTLENPGDSFSVREKLVVLPNGIIAVEDTIDVGFVSIKGDRS